MRLSMFCAAPFTAATSAHESDKTASYLPILRIAAPHFGANGHYRFLRSDIATPYPTPATRPIRKPIAKPMARASSITVANLRQHLGLRQNALCGRLSAAVLPISDSGASDPQLTG